MSDRRPKRRCVAAKNSGPLPSAIHYVGYVEDDETPEMIMKKFEELERIKKAAEARRQQQQQQQRQPTPEAEACVPPALTGPQPSEPKGGTAPRPLPKQPASHAATSLPGSAPPGSNTQSQQPASLPSQSTLQLGEQAELILPANEQQLIVRQLDDNSDQALLDEEALLEVFKQTSIFNVRSAVCNNETGGEGPHGTGRYDGYGAAYGTEDACFVDGEFGGFGSDFEEDEAQYNKGFWSDEDFELGGGGGGGSGAQRHREGSAGSRRRKGGASGSREAGGGGEARPPRPPGRPRMGSISAPTGNPAPSWSGPSGQSRQSAAAHQMVTQYNRDTNALIRRRVAASGGGGGGLVQLRVPPPPLPLSWGRTVRPYQPPEDPGAATEAPSLPAAGASASTAATDAASSSRGFESPDLQSFSFDAVLGGKTYLAVVLNAGWQPPGAADVFEEGGEAEVMRRLRVLPLPRLCPRGFIMVWAHKGLLQPVCRAMAAWGYVYVENLTWVHLTPGNAIASGPGRHFRRSHSTLLMFRREGEGRDIELRHQRNPDVVFDCLRCIPGEDSWEVAAEVMSTIETLLPGGKGAFLELWAPRGSKRPGWDHVSEVKA